MVAAAPAGSWQKAEGWRCRGSRSGGLRTGRPHQVAPGGGNTPAPDRGIKPHVPLRATPCSQHHVSSWWPSWCLFMGRRSHQRTAHLAVRRGRPEEVTLGAGEGRAHSQQVPLAPRHVPADVHYLAPQGALSALQPRAQQQLVQSHLGHQLDPGARQHAAHELLQRGFTGAPGRPSDHAALGSALGSALQVSTTRRRRSCCAARLRVALGVLCRPARGGQAEQSRAGRRPRSPDPLRRPAELSYRSPGHLRSDV